VQRKQITYWDYGVVHVHLPQLEVWTQVSYYWVGEYPYSWSQNILKGWSWGNFVWKDIEEWMWRRVQVHLDAREGYSLKLAKDIIEREIPLEEWSRD
jgi:hypothetical protein